MIKENDYVIFRKKDFTKLFQIKKNKPIMIDRMKCDFNKVLEERSFYGFKYQVTNGELRLVDNENDQNINNNINNNININININNSDQEKETEEKDEEENGKTNGSTETTTRDNRNLNDLTTNQKLSHEDIQKLKPDLSGTELIDRLVENSASFHTKTEFSQQKYIKKKKEKYLTNYELLKPTIRILCEYYMQGFHKRRLLNLRVDTIAQMLTYSNVAANRNCMLVESCKGLILAAVAERVGGLGKIVNFSPNGAHSNTKETMDYMNFPASITKDVFNFPLEKSDKMQEYIDHLAHKVETVTNNPGYIEKQTQKLENAKVIKEICDDRQMDCLVIATKFRPLPILEKLIGYLGSNKYFVIYSQLQQPLIECHTFLKRNKKAVHLELSDSWMREYQVLPNRTHPLNMMDCCGGFILSGITVD